MNYLQTTLQKCLDESLILAIKNCSLASEVTLFLQQLLGELEKDDENISFTQILLQVNTLFVFHHYFFCVTDKKILKRLLDVNKKAAACTIIGNIIWYPEDFLLKQIPTLTKSIDKKLWVQNRQLQLTTRSQNLHKTSLTLFTQVCIFYIFN